MLYNEQINGCDVYFSEGVWIVEDEYGWSPYSTYAEAKAAAEEGSYTTFLDEEE